MGSNKYSESRGREMVIYCHCLRSDGLTLSSAWLLLGLVAFGGWWGWRLPRSPGRDIHEKASLPCRSLGRIGWTGVGWVGGGAGGRWGFALSVRPQRT